MEVCTFFLSSIPPGADSLGLLIGACVNRAPEGTFGAAVAEVPALDMLKVSPNPVK